MPKCLTLSLLKLELECNTSTSTKTATTKNSIILPATPTALKRYGINSPKYLEIRNKLIKSKTTISGHNTRLREYQDYALNFLLQPEIKCKAIFDEQRLGKTPTTITYLKITKQNALMVTPKSLLYQWRTEYKEWNNDNILVIDGTIAKRQKLYKQITKNTSVLISYDTLKQDEDTLIKYTKYFDVIIIDEAHRIRNIKNSRKTQPKTVTSLLTISNKIEKRIALTGTPAANQSDEIYGILKFLFPDIFASYYYFRDMYFYTDDIYTSQNTITKCNGIFKPGMKQELLEFLDLISIQRKRKEVMKWLPKYDIQKIKLEFNKMQLEAYDSIKQYYEYKDIICLSDLEQLTCLRQITNCPKVLDIPDNGSKFNYILDYIKDYPEESIIIVSTFTRPLQLLKQLLNKSELIIGETKSSKRELIKQQFQSKRLKLILANIAVVKEGFTLDTADTIIFIDSSYIYTDNIQCMDRLVPVSIDRVHDKTQKIILLLLENSIDEYVYDMVYVKKATSTDIINNYKKYIKETK